MWNSFYASPHISGEPSGDAKDGEAHFIVLHSILPSQVFCNWCPDAASWSCGKVNVTNAEERELCVINMWYL